MKTKRKLVGYTTATERPGWARLIAHWDNKDQTTVDIVREEADWLPRLSCPPRDVQTMAAFHATERARKNRLRPSEAREPITQLEEDRIAAYVREAYANGTL